MAIFRQYIAPFLIVLVFLVALLSVTARIFLPSDMAAPAPMEEVESASSQTSDTTAKLQAVEAPTLPTSASSVN
jgi:Na+-transporting methylmalonyl-CoA/oxaloacetate decarboxylase gamma subunit